MRRGVAASVAQRLLQNAERRIHLRMNGIAQRGDAQIRQSGEHVVDQRTQGPAQRVRIQRADGVQDRTEPLLQRVRLGR